MKTIKEIERRYLVMAIDPDIRCFPNRLISQGYFDTPPNFDLRVRITDGRTAELTRKTGGGVERAETTVPVPIEVGRFLFESCGDVIDKTRYLRDGWEVDFFHGPLEGLVLAEFESPEAAGRITIPSWINDAAEVTLSLSNRHLARLARDLADSKADRPVRDLLPKRIPRIVLTGGPGSGKSSLMQLLRQELGDRLHCVPEVATIVIAQVGVKPPVGDPVGMKKFQRTIYRVQRGFETVSDLQAARDGKQALLLDRGALDSAAYMDGGVAEFERVCRTDRAHEHSNYDLVICLATPPRKVYEANRTNNPARSEDYALAKKLGKSIRAVWGGHPAFRHIGEGVSWKEKVTETVACIRRFLDNL